MIGLHDYLREPTRVDVGDLENGHNIGIYGTIGSGKTTSLQHLLNSFKQHHDERDEPFKLILSTPLQDLKSLCDIYGGKHVRVGKDVAVNPLNVPYVDPEKYRNVTKGSPWHGFLNRFDTFLYAYYDMMDLAKIGEKRDTWTMAAKEAQRRQDTERGDPESYRNPSATIPDVIEVLEDIVLDPEEFVRERLSDEAGTLEKRQAVVRDIITHDIEAFEPDGRFSHFCEQSDLDLMEHDVIYLDHQSVGILHDERYRHIFCGGQTGAGKTVAAKNAVQQDALAGHGACVIDPGGEDILDIVRSLPEYRLDDLIYMEPGNEYRSHSIGLNYLDTLHNPGEPGYKKECESIATNLLPMLNADEFARMKGVASNMLRYLIKADHEDDDYEYTLIDLYYMLASDDARQQYAEKVNESKLDFLKVYANKIADLAGDDLEPLLRRLQTWVENDVMRPFIAQRDSDFSIADAVENQRIVLVKANLGKNEREMITAALTTKLWSAVTSRPNADEHTMMEYEGVDVPELGADEGGDHKPFFLVADEFHAVASENTDIGEMLAMARKKGLGLYILTQQLGQLSDEQEQQILGNCSTLMAFDPGRHPKERRALASGFDGISEPDLGIGRYKFWTTLTDAEGDESQAFLTHSIPPFPPVRSVKEANETLNRSQKLHGSKRLTDQEIIDQVPDEFSIEAAKEHLGDETTDDGSAKRPALVRAKALQAIYDEGYYNGDPDGFVSLQEASDRIARYVERVSNTVPDTPSKIEGLIGQFLERLLERDRRGELHVRCTDEGKARFLSPVDEDDEVSENTGGFEHAELMRAAYDDLLAIGLPLHVVRQGGDDDPDALAEPESAELRRANSNPTLKPTEVASLVEQFREENPLLDRLTDAGMVDIEAEHSTSDSAPGVTLEHIARSIANGRRCLLFAWPDTAEAIARRLDEDPKCMRTFSGEDGVHRLYNANGDVRAGPNEVKVYRPAGGQTVWLSHEGRPGIELRDSDGETLATFDNPEDVFTDPTVYPATETDITDFNEWTAIKRPALPGRIDRSMVDVIAVTDDGLEVLEPSGDRTPIGELLDESSNGDTADRDQEQADDDNGAFADLL